MPHLREGEIKTAVMGESGRDIILSPTAEDSIPFDIESKNTERLNLWDSLTQARENTKKGRIPLVVFKRNRSDVYACLPFEDLLNLCFGDGSKDDVDSSKQAQGLISPESRLDIGKDCDDHC